MPNPTNAFDLHRSIAALLESRGTGTAVAAALDERMSDWQTRAVVADLRERRAQHRYDLKLAALFPAEMDAASH
jgi:hypothetical protein